MTEIKDDIKMREAIIGTTQTVYALKEQGHNILSHESISIDVDWTFSMPKGTKRIAVIYFD